MKKYYESLLKRIKVLERKANTANKSQIYNYLNNSAIAKRLILPYLYDQDSNMDPPNIIKFVFKKTRPNVLQFVKNNISQKEVVSIFKADGFSIIESLTDGFIITNGNINIALRQTSKDGSTAKLVTTAQTELKEEGVRYAIQYKLTSSDDRNEIVDHLLEYAYINPALSSYYNNDSFEDTLYKYADGSILSAAAFYSKCPININDYDIELRGYLTEPIEDLVRDFGVSKMDNWNPGDIFLYKKNFDIDEFVYDYENTNLSLFTDAFNSEVNNLNIIPISLKLPDNNSAICLTPDKIKSVLPDNYNSIKNIGLRYSNESRRSVVSGFVIYINDNYKINCHAKNISSGALVCNYEPAPVGAGHQDGGADSKLIQKYVYNGNDIKSLQIELSRNPESNANINLINSYIDSIYHSGISIDGNAKELKDMYAYNGENKQKVLAMYVMVIVNLYYFTKNWDKIINGKTVLEHIVLSGAKVSDEHSIFYKIY